MKKFLMFLSKLFSWVFLIPKYLIISILISVVVGLITWNVIYGFFTLLGIIIAITIFVLGRQLWWLITKKGDYENKDKKK